MLEQVRTTVSPSAGLMTSLVRVGVAGLSVMGNVKYRHGDTLEPDGELVLFYCDNRSIRRIEMKFIFIHIESNIIPLKYKAHEIKIIYTKTNINKHNVELRRTDPDTKVTGESNIKSRVFQPTAKN